MDLLQYNAFGVAVVSSTEVSVTAAIVVNGQARRRIFRQQLETPLGVNGTTVLMLGAWIEKNKDPRVNVLEMSSGEASDTALLPQVRDAIRTVTDALKLALR